MGTGLDRTYPRNHAQLRQEIIDKGGLVMTHFEPGASITRASFPKRNAVMSGYGITTFVVTATEHSSTRTQAVSAVKHGRGVILAHRVVESTSWGQELAHSGQAQVAYRTSDVLDHVYALQTERQQAERLLREIMA